MGVLGQIQKRCAESGQRNQQWQLHGPDCLLWVEWSCLLATTTEEKSKLYGSSVWVSINTVAIRIYELLVEVGIDDPRLGWVHVLVQAPFANLPGKLWCRALCFHSDNAWGACADAITKAIIRWWKMACNVALYQPQKHQQSILSTMASSRPPAVDSPVGFPSFPWVKNEFMKHRVVFVY